MKIKAEFIGKDMFSQELNRIILISEENISIFKEYGYNFLFEVEIKPKKVKRDKVNKESK
jgi:hypothetical protein